MILSISKLLIYPIKSLGAIAVDRALVTDRGLENDRRWLLVDDENRFMTLRKFPSMALLQPFILEDRLVIHSKGKDIEDLLVPFERQTTSLESVTIWNATCQAYVYPSQVNAWFSDVLQIPCKLVYMPEESKRPVDTTTGFKPAGKLTSFADAYPFMMVSQASMDDLNQRIRSLVSVARFRPNIVIEGGTPYIEDRMKRFVINGIEFTGLEKCGRCNVPNIDPDTGTEDPAKDTMKTLASYRLEGGKVYFGMNLVHTGAGIIGVGDLLEVRAWHA